MTRSDGMKYFQLDRFLSDSEARGNSTLQVASYSQNESENSVSPTIALGMDIKQDSGGAGLETSDHPNLQLQIISSYSLSDCDNNLSSGLETKIKEDSNGAGLETSDHPNLQLQITSSYSLSDCDNNLSSGLETKIKEDSNGAGLETSDHPNLQLQIISSYSLSDCDNNLSSGFEIDIKEDPITESTGDPSPRVDLPGYSRHETVIKWCSGSTTYIKEDPYRPFTKSRIDPNPHLKSTNYYPNEFEKITNPKDPLGMGNEDHNKIPTPREQPTFSCDYCNYKTLDSAWLVKHSQKHPKKTFRCAKCPFQTSYKKVFERHTSKPCDKQNRYPCDQCDYQTNNSSYLKIHRRMHAGDKTYSCTVCTYKTCFSNGLKVHMRKHTGERPYRCDRCDYRAAVIGVLKNHVERVHTEKSAQEVERPFWCTVCPLKFASNYALKKHMMTHTGERPFSCDVCFSSFTQRGTLVKHLRTHSGEKPFKCERCEFKTACSKTLKNHVHRVHPTLSIVEGRLSELIGSDGNSNNRTLDDQCGE